MEEKTKGFFAEFKEFISRGNVLDMAVGVIVATAFGKITGSLVNDVIMPLFGWMIGDFDLSKFNITLSEAVLNDAGEVVYLANGAVGDANHFVADVVDILRVGKI